MPNLIALAAEIAPAGRRAAVTSAMFCGMPGGGAVVSLLARLAGEHADWRMLFLIGGGLPILISRHWSSGRRCPRRGRRSLPDQTVALAESAPRLLGLSARCCSGAPAC